MNQYLKLIAPAIGATLVAVPFMIADFVSDQASIEPQIAVERLEEKKLENGSQAVEVPAKEDTETDKAVAGKEITPAEPGKTEVVRVAAMVMPIDDEIKTNAAPTEPDKAEAEKAAALAGSGTVETKKAAMLTMPGAMHLALTLQTELKRVGCYDGALDGLWSRQARAALYEFGNSSKIETTDFDPSEAWIRHVKDNTETVCDGAYDDVDRPQHASWSGDELRYVYRSQPVPSSGDDLRDVDRPEQVSRSGDDLRYAQRPQQHPKPGDSLRYVHRPKQNEGPGAEISYGEERPSEEVDWGYWGTAGEVDDGH